MSTLNMWAVHVPDPSVSVTFDRLRWPNITLSQITPDILCIYLPRYLLERKKDGMAVEFGTGDQRWYWYKYFFCANFNSQILCKTRESHKSSVTRTDRFFFRCVSESTITQCFTQNKCHRRCSRCGTMLKHFRFNFWNYDKYQIRTS